MSKEELLMNVDGEIVKESELQQIKADLERLEKLEEEKKLLVSGEMTLISTSAIDKIHEMQEKLGVLKILKKYLYLSGWEGDEDYPRDLRLEICDYSHVVEENEEEYADYNKVKQWLEENE